MTTSDENNTITEKNYSVEKNYRYSVENGNRNIFRDPNLDKQEKDDEGKTEKCWFHFIIYSITSSSFPCMFYLTDEKSCKNIILKYLCGAGKQDEDEDEKLKEHMAKVAELQQDKMAAVCLNIGLVVILMIGAFLYFFWSFWRYEP